MSGTFLLREPADWTDSMVIVAFPTAGIAGNIAGHYLRKHLSLPLLGSLHLEGVNSVVAVEDGVSAAPIRVYGGEVECRLGEGKCPRIYLIVTDLPMDPVATAMVTEAIVKETKGCSLVLCLDAVVRAADDPTPDVYASSPDPEVLDQLIAPNVTRLPEGIIVGMTSHILLAAERGDLRGGALLVEATRDLPDGRAAAALVKAVDHLIPQVQVDPEPLQKEAEELEKMVRKAQQDAETHDRRGPFSSYI